MDLLVVFGCLVVWTGSIANSDELAPLPVSAFSFDQTLTENGTMPEATVMLSVRLTAHSNPECLCRLRCLSIRECRGYGFSDASQTCQLTQLLPTRQRLQPGKDTWKWNARGGRRQLNESCSTHQDCALTVPGAECRNNTCTCGHPFVPTGDGQCRKVGQFRYVGTGRLRGSALWEAAATSADECRSLGTVDPHFMAFDFSSSEQRCTFYGRGITSDAGSGRDTESFVWYFSAADGEPPEDFQLVNGTYLALRESEKPRDGAFACFPAILYPAVTASALTAIFSSPLLSSAHRLVVVGIDDMLSEGQYTTSDWANVTAEELPWGNKERHNPDNEDCLLGGNGTVHDFICGSRSKKPALCQFEGVNLALHRPAWISPSDNHFTSRLPAENAVDGNLTTMAHSGLADPATWTVDLGGAVQVTGVLLASRGQCCYRRSEQILNLFERSLVFTLR